MRVSKADGSQTTDLQYDALIRAGVVHDAIYEDHASGKLDDRLQLSACLKALNKGDTLIVWHIDRLGRTLRHLINTVHELTEKGIGFRVLEGHCATLDTTTPNGKLMFGFLCLIAEYERDILIARTKAGVIAARERGRIGGRRFKMTEANLLFAREHLAAGGKISEVSKALNISPQTLYRHLAPDSSIRPMGNRMIASVKPQS
ncbi:MAG: recombinase family protein [Bacteroidota bacterium]